jgi:peptide/nickel transport system permease protein
MLRYILRRILGSLLLLWGVVTLTFVLVHVAPGDPTDILVDPSFAPEDVELIRHRYGLDEPVWGQYLHWMEGLAHGDLGISLRHKRPVADILAEAVPNTLRLSVLSLLLWLMVGCTLGVISAARRGTATDRGLTLISLVVYSLPSFWLGLMLQLVFVWKLRWFPSGGMAAGSLEDLGLGPWLLSSAEHLVLPVAVLGLSGAAGLARYMRSSMLEILGQDFIRTARAKGLPEGQVLFKHALRNAAIPLVTLLGLSLPFLLSGAVVTEVIFSWPGMGQVAVQALLSRDHPVILATTLLAGVLVVLGNLLADLAYGLVDPRIRAR